jgi:hypothetical protein
MGPTLAKRVHAGYLWKHAVVLKVSEEEPDGVGMSEPASQP